MNCSKCGAEVQGQVKFCPSCGSCIEEVAAPVQDSNLPVAPADSVLQGSYYPPQDQPAAAQARPVYPMTDSDRTLRLIAFILCVISTVIAGFAIIPLVWMIPMTIISWGIYKGTKRNTVAFGVCVLLFCSLISGILLLCSHKDA